MKNLSLSKKELEQVREKARQSIRQWVASSKTRGVAYGLSGGLDSAVVCKLAAEAKADAHALILPEEGVTEQSFVDDAVELADKLKVDYTVMWINPILEAYGKASPSKVKDRVAWGNVKARVRMTLIYLAANTENRIVLGTGNRTELLMGYYTKHGDGGVDFQPIGGLYKTQVKQLARHIGVPGKILRKTPTAGLWAKQTDEKELGIDYGTLDRILYCLAEEWRGLGETAAKTGVPKKKIREVLERVQKNRHKMEGPLMADVL